MDHYEKMQIEYAMENFVNRKLEKIKNITLLEIIYDPTLRILFQNFIQRGHTVKTEPTILFERFLICENILKNPKLIDNKQIVNQLIEKCTTFESEQHLSKILRNKWVDLHIIRKIEKFKWETMIELICNRDYKNFLTALKEKSTFIKRLLIFIYGEYFFN